ncbi:MAG: hypothetical protein IKZ53_06855 [Selenomonadaceae bacterium]|nr:hypothetical protein [Selenomonadaceae bacterium]
MASFKEKLVADNVVEDAKKIVPKLAANRQRLEVSKIEKIIAKETDGNFDKMANDRDVYEALKRLNKNDLRLVFKACVESLGYQCNFEDLHRKNGDRVLALFFHVFSVYPEEIPTPENNIPVNNSSIEFDSEQFARVFPNFGDAVEVDFSKVAGNLPTQYQNVTSIDELKQSLSAEKIPQGKIVRDFVKATLEISGIEFDWEALNGISKREDYLPLFFRAINFVFPKKQKAAPKSPTIADKKIPELTFAHMQALYDAAQKVSATDLDFDISNKLKIFENTPVTLNDKFYVSVPEGKEIYRGLAAIATLDNEIAAVGRVEDGIIIERGAEKLFPHLVFDWKKIDKDKLINRKTFLAVLMPAESEEFLSNEMSQNFAASYSGEVWTMEFSIEYSKLEVTDKPLCIDFGTSNTTAGTYNLEEGGKPEQVTFRDVTSDEIVFSEVLPTVVYVERCHNGIVTLKHGYEAKREIIKASYNTKATVFHEIKRWINSLDTVEEVTGEDGRETAQITRREILRDYLLYVIRAAEQKFQVKFKNLHMTAPVKLRNKFLDEMDKIFTPLGYKVSKDSLDEGLATVYHYIARRIQSIGDTSGKILILDCGGGTTDLASCNFSIERGGDWPVLKLETDFESGDSNFGGNNITYRILQMLKMKIAANLERKENLQMYDLIPDEDDDILSQIDCSYINRDKIYEEFEKSYAQAEDFIPTRFAEYTMKNERIKVKRNFYYLWQLAEAIKIEFFKSNLVNVDFEKDKKIFVRSPEECYLSIRVGNSLQTKSDPMDGIEITIREISRILLPDLYALLTTLLHHYKDSELMEYKYQLSGQSCKINKFRDLFKEFVPGKQMRIAQSRKSKNRQQVDSVVLKKYCILGSIEYVRDAKASGKYKAIVDSKRTRRIYAVSNILDNDETALLGRDGSLSFKKFHFETTDARFLVRGENNRLEREISYHFYRKSDSMEGFTLKDLIKLMADETNYKKEELMDKLGDKLQAVELSTDKNGKVQPIFCLAALDAKSGYGFNIYQICVNKNAATGAVGYWLPKKRQFESYEDENLQTFFNGDK